MNFIHLDGPKRPLARARADNWKREKTGGWVWLSLPPVLKMKLMVWAISSLAPWENAPKDAMHKYKFGFGFRITRPAR